MRSSNQGSVSLAVLFLAIVSIMIFSLAFMCSYMNFQTSMAFDSYTSQMVEKAGLEQIVQDAILSTNGTSPTLSTKTLETEIRDRLSAVTFASGVSVSLASVGTPPQHVFWPSATSPVASTLPVSGVGSIAGSGNRTLAYLEKGPAAELGACIVVFHRTVSGHSDESRDITVTARLFSVPVTNINTIAYALPSLGSIPAARPSLPTSFTDSPSNSRLIMSYSDPTRDPTFFPDTYDPADPERISNQFQNDVLFAWDAYEYIWSGQYLITVQNAAGAGNTYDFDSSEKPTINGVTPNGADALTIDAATVTADTIAVVDMRGGRSVVINGSASSGPPFVIYLRCAEATSSVRVTLTGNNNRPFLLFVRRGAVTFTGNPQLQAALFLDPNSQISGDFRLYGHLSIYFNTASLLTYGMQQYDNPSLKQSLAPFAPRVLLVSTRSTM